MPKYIDLLRSHLQKGKIKTAAEPSETEDVLVDEQPEKGRLLASTVKKTPPQNLRSDLIVEEQVSEKTVKARSQAVPSKELEKTLRNEQPWYDQPGDSSNAAIQWLKSCVQLTLQTFQAAGSNHPISIDALSKHTLLLVRALMKNPDGLHGLELQVSNHDHNIRNIDFDLGSLIAKSIALMLYAIKMGMRMRLSESALHSLVLAAMLHHIGMAQVPASIRHKKGALSNKEREFIRKAPNLGETYLKSCGVTDTDILAAVVQAQERHDGSGPLGLSGSGINNVARIVGLLSVFEALIAFRPYRKRLLPRDAIQELIKKHKAEFDLSLLKILIEAISLYPVGTYVQLNSGDVGQIIVVHERLPMRPKIRLSMDRYGNEIITRIVDLQTQPNLRVSRCMYKEELSELKGET